MPMSESVLQMSLAQDPIFLKRLQYTMVQQARVVKEEPGDTPYHNLRTGYASQVLQNPQMTTMSASTMVVGGPNIIGTVDLTDNGITTSATDAAIFAQVSTYWNTLSGVDSTTPTVPPPPAPPAI